MLHFLVVLFTFFISTMAASENFKLELVQVLFRHGARTCSKSEAEVPMPAYVDKAFHETYGYDQLTNIGKAQAHKLGCALRERYNEFLGEVYHPREVYAYSTDYDRTKMSLQLVLAGLYPPGPEQTWNPNLNWMPIPFHYVPRELDIMLRPFDFPKYKQKLMETKTFLGYEEKAAKVLELIDFFESKGIDSLKKYKLVAVMGIFNVLYSHKVSKATLPDWYTDELLEKLRSNVEDSFDLWLYTTEMKKISCGLLIQKFIENMNVKDIKVNPRKIYLFSAHDLNISAVTRSHNIKEFRYPGFSSALVIEKLRDSQNKLYVRMLAWTGEDDKFITLNIDKFGEFCPMEEYLKFVEHVIPTEEETNSIFGDDNVDVKKAHTTDFVFRPKYEL